MTFYSPASERNSLGEHASRSEINKQVLALQAQVNRLVRRLQGGTRPSDGPGLAVVGAADRASRIRAWLRARDKRTSFFGPDLFADPAWDILLELYLSHLEQQKVSVTSACVAARVPSTTGLRWLKTLEDRGIIHRSRDPLDGRRMFVALTPKGEKAMDGFAEAAQLPLP